MFNPRKLPLILVMVLTLIVVDSCSVNPVTGKKELMLMSANQEIQMGKEADPQIVASFGLYEDSRMQNFISEKGKQMARISHRPDLPYEFKVLDSPVVNAFAVPGGYVYFTRGIMAHFNNEAEFAGVLGHEIGHVTARHSARQQTTQILGTLGLIVGLAVSEDFRQFADVAQQGLGLLFLKFSRDHESESDKLGVEYSTKIGYNSLEMASFFSTLDRLGDKSSGSIPTFLSTHPDPADREFKVKAMSIKAQRALKDPGNLKVNRDSYLDMIDGIVYGNDPKQGFVENGAFYHPELRFQFPVPQGWKYENSPIQFQMAPDNGQALMLLTLGQGKSLDEVARNVVNQYKLSVYNSERTSINGNPALILNSEQKVPEGQTVDPSKIVNVNSYLIQYGGNIYVLHGLTYAGLLETYAYTFDEVAYNFRDLNDPDKLNRQPERIRLAKVERTTTLGSALRDLGMPADRLEELSILNGMELNQQVRAGMRIKTVAGSR